MIDYDLTSIRALVFDVDGVLSDSTVAMSVDGEPLRTLNIKDGYAIRLAVRQGLEVGIITGARTESVVHRYRKLGVKHIYIGASVKTREFDDFLAKTNLTPEAVLFMGDDIPDYEVLRLVALPVCPADAAPEVKAICRYISPVAGGHGCARDVIEQVMKAQGLWMSDDAFGW